jgi:hypothetical protein
LSLIVRPENTGTVKIRLELGAVVICIIVMHLEGG